MKTKQAPIHSGYGERTTAREAVGNRDLNGAIAIVTGGHAGIGIETTRALADAGATVIVGARTLDTARAALAGIARIELDTLDLFDPASIDAFAARFVASGRPLHMLVNNAGIMAPPLVRDARGFESQLATNHIGHFQLTARLWPALRKANGARVVSLSSRGHGRAGIDFEDPQFERRAYDKWKAYGQSKTANALFALALDTRGEAHRVRAFAVHPGAVMTDLLRTFGHLDNVVLAPQPRELGTHPGQLRGERIELAAIFGTRGVEAKPRDRHARGCLPGRHCRARAFVHEHRPQAVPELDGPFPEIAVEQRRRPIVRDVIHPARPRFFHGPCRRWRPL